MDMLHHVVITMQVLLLLDNPDVSGKNIKEMNRLHINYIYMYILMQETMTLFLLHSCRKAIRCIYVMGSQGIDDSNGCADQVVYK